MLRQSQTLGPKAKLNHTLQSWLPILQASSEDLKETLEPLVSGNPFVSIETNPKSIRKKSFFSTNTKNSTTDNIESLCIYEKSLYEKLYEQINKPLFPTQKSQNIAYKIIECINNEGYFEEDSEIYKEYSKDEIESIRARFSLLEPIGVGSKNYKESFLFQLEDMQIDSELYDICKKLIENFENLEEFVNLTRYSEAMNIIKKFKNPPAIEYLENQMQAISDIIVTSSSDGIQVSINDDYYPKIVIENEYINNDNEFISSRIKEGLDLIDALEMRKSTLYKIGLMIIEYQYDYFIGGDIKPMRLKDIAVDLGRNPSTISRAITNKFLSSPRGTVPLKLFFAGAASEEVSNVAIKEFIQNAILSENKKKPLSDFALLEMAQKEFDVSLVRRTITKYRKSLNIGSSSQRKKLYAITH
ncbi:RNA polymerase factor sigma-54 [Campylobacter sp. RM12327]|uniref:RNA polymerase factor sigma-54 n=1 Tax=Campylobacter sputorum TaxID=206 RepID=UPI000B78B732|nr:MULTISPECIES: RNA polymerase factor sigma-54 [Campylobacter]ASM40364.1 RNA polymerase sigma54 factor [Campylobacter sputorum]MBE7357363.1 RNA polymerase factor sigma-54 [Campylobacter sp. RM11302]MBF6668673.1 RNA polymerase factor sigma-54 [Campylobacter sp. RM12327]MBF6674071.1 RNA polymerase factor sigma-54 [Campylobacter sp. RM13538]MBF6675540.1 RNA polymerase factor sigma-54 [Campylobacter sp. RM12321]